MLESYSKNNKNDLYDGYICCEKYINWEEENRMKNRLITIALTAAILLTNTNSCIYADTNADINSEINVETVAETNTETNKDITMSYHGELDISATPLVEKNDEIANYKASSSDAIPASYKTDNLPEIKNQNPYGSCWAFSATTVAEMSLIKKENTTLNLSELHLINFTNRTVEDPLGGTKGDNNSLANPDNMLNVGGNQIFAMQSYAAWVGAAAEEKVPYGTAADVQQNGLDDKYAYDDVAHLKNAYIINLQEDVAAAKKVIMDNGALGASYYDDTNNGNSIYNKLNNSYYCDAQKTANHAVAIVGWDDNFSKENFNSMPEGNGAWLIRNSWGGNEETDDYCHEGYFWLSYYDKSLDEEAFAFEFVTDKNTSTDEFYDNNYQYDGGVYPGWIEYAKAANVFKAQKGQETLKAICFGTKNTCEGYTVKIYKNLTDTSNPESGTLVSTTTGETTFEGMHTVQLSQVVKLEYADTFSVVIELTGEKGTSFLCETPKSGSWFNSETYAEEGQSFLYISKWNDFGKKYNRNIRIKAFTDTVIEEIEIPSEDEIEVSLDADELIFTKESSNQDLSAMVKYKNSGENINYSTTYELSQDAIDAGYSVEKNSDGTYTISLDTTKEIPTGEYILSIYAVDFGGVKTGKYQSVKLKSQKINIENYELNLDYYGNVYTGNEIRPEISLSSDEYLLIENTDYEVSYSNNINVGEATATVTGIGWYDGTLSKTYTIEKANKSITVPARSYSKTEGDATFSLGASTVAGERLSYSSSNTFVARVSENGTVTVVGAGTTTITITSPESANYEAAQNVTVSINVTAAPTPQPQPDPTPQPQPDPTPQPQPDPTPQPGNESQEKAVKTITVSKTSYTKVYGDKAFSLGAKTAAGETLKYATSDKKVVTVSALGKVTVKGIGKATITITSPESASYKAATPVKVTITISPKSVKLSTVKSVKTKAIKVTWKKDTSVTGYEILYAQKSNFKGAKKVTVTKNKTVSATIKKLTKDKTYYVKVRAYKTVKGKKIYGAYSTVKKVKVTK